MRRAGPILILLIGVLALLVDFFPGLAVPDSDERRRQLAPARDQARPRPRGWAAGRVPGAAGRGPSRPAPRDMAIIKDIVERRVNTTGVSEPVVVTQGSDRVVVELPGVTDAGVRPQAGRPDRPPRLRAARHDARPRRARSSTSRRSRRCSAATRSRRRRSAPTRTAGPAVDFVLKDEGAKLFADYTAQHIGEYFAITLDSAVISAPVIQNSIPNGQVQISGGGLARLRRQGRQRPRHDPQVRLAAVPDPGAVERADQRHARQPVPRPRACWPA